MCLLTLPVFAESLTYLKALSYSVCPEAFALWIFQGQLGRQETSVWPVRLELIAGQGH